MVSDPSSLDSTPFVSDPSVQDQAAESYLGAYDRPISVSAMDKLKQFPMLQQLGFAGGLGHMKDTFHGLQDFFKQMDKYSATSPSTLVPAWNVIKMIAPVNPEVGALVFTADGLGTVGKDFLSIHNFGEIFAKTRDELEDLGDKVKDEF